jgi:hypothetical protein
MAGPLKMDYPRAFYYVSHQGMKKPSAILFLQKPHSQQEHG